MRNPFILVLLVLSSCGMQQAERDGDSERADSTLRAVNRRLELVNQKLGIVPVTSRVKESSSNIADNHRIQHRIYDNIGLIDSMMSDIRSRLTSLERMLGASNRRLGEYEQEISNLEQSIDSKQLEIDSLRKSLVRSANLAGSLHDSLATAYVLVAPQDSLARWKVIEKNGGMFGMFGSSWQFSGNVPLRRCSRINLLKTGRIIVPAKAGSFTLMTPHNRKSYLVKTESGRRSADSSVIVISNPNEFWATSHILVIKLPQ